MNETQAQKILDTPVQNLYEMLLINELTFDSHGISRSVGSCPNFRHTFHCYACTTDEKENYLLFVQAHIDAIYTPHLGIVFRHPNCYLANAHDQNLLESDAHEFHRRISEKDWGSKTAIPVLLSGSQSHLAHYLWNHLSALWRLCSHSSNVNGSRISLYAYPNSQLFGSLARILQRFQHLELNVDYNLPSPLAQGSYVLYPYVFIEPYENGFIPEALTSTIREMALETHSQSTIKLKRVYSYGARVHSRRALNRDSIFKSYVESLASRANGPFTLVIDISSRMNRETSQPDDPESDILASHLAELATAISKDIDIIRLVNSPILETLSKLSNCELGVYEWGANLTWFSWILRKQVVSLMPPTAAIRLRESSLRLETWGSFFWESDSPSPLVPESHLKESNVLSTDAHRHRFSADDYIVDPYSFHRTLCQAFARADRTST
jgi:hypothetical protein